MADRCPTDVYYEFHGMEQKNYNPIEIARQYAPKFDKPAVDMVEVVRCKDCVYWEQAKPDSGSCNRAFEITAYANDFCSYGERRDEVKE